MTRPKGLIVQGGFPGHEPEAVAELFRQVLAEQGFDVEVSDTLDAFNDAEKLKTLDLIVPHWTGEGITKEQVEAVSKAVQGGVGLAGCHGGLCDAFRSNAKWKFLTGGQFAGHPGGKGVEYEVRVHQGSSPIVEGIGNFTVKSEQYYLLVDPAVKVLATTRFPVAESPNDPNGPVDMPVLWTKLWGKGRVFYSSLGHDADILRQEPALTLVRRGFRWAATGRT